MKDAWIRRLLALLVLAWAAPAVCAQHWEATGGPLGGSVSALLIDGETSFAATRHGGFFRSDDFGDDWSRLDVLNSLESITGLAVDSEGRFFASTSTGARRSADGGTTWDPIDNGLPNSRNTADIVVDANDVVFLAMRIAGVYRSTDGGETWIAANSGLTNTAMTALAAAPDGTLYAGTSNGIFMSTDSGDSWTDISEGLPSPAIGSLAVAPDGTLWAAAFGLYRRTGNTWDNLFGESAWSVSATTSGRVIVGFVSVVRFTDNGGDNWLEYTVEDDIYTSIDALAAQGDVVLAGSSNRGVYRSTDGGISWAPARTGFRGSVLNDLAVGTSGELYGATNAGVFRSRDGGSSWEHSIDGLPITNVEGLGIVGNNVLLAGSNNDGIWISVDGADSWDNTDESLFQVGFRSFAEAADGDLFAGSRSGRVYRADSEVTGWDSVDVNSDESTVEAIVIDGDGAIYAGSQAGVRRSADGGDLWEDANSGLPESPGVQAFLLMPDGRILLACFWGVYQSADSGNSWTKLGDTPGLGLRALARDSDGNLYVGIRGVGAAYSTDEGATWTSINEGLNNLDVTSLEVVPNAGKGGGLARTDDIYVGTRGGGVSRLVSVATTVEDFGPTEINGIRLRANFPNPFAVSTSISVELERPMRVVLKVYDMLGREVRRVDQRRLPGGVSELRLDGRDLAPGMYLYRLDADGFSAKGSLLKQ